MAVDSTATRSPGKPASRSAGRKHARRIAPEDRLRVHKGTGYWCKKVNGRVYYFGRVADDPEGTAAHDQWLREKDDLRAGREPRDRVDGPTVEELCFRYLAHHEGRRDTGELNPRSYAALFAAAETMAKTIGRTRAVADLAPDDFRRLRAKLARTRGLVSLRNEIQRVRGIFKFAFDEGLVPAPVKYGQGFAKPKLEAVRRAREAHRAEHGDRMFEADELRAVIAACGQPLKAMVLLAANAAFGQSDIAALPTRAADLDAGWVDFARVKTAVRRRVPLWPETVAAIREWLPIRPRATNPADAGCLFLTVRGTRWVKSSAPGERADEDGRRGPGGSPGDAVIGEFNKVLRRLKLKRPGRSFYAIRHGFETIGGETADQVAVDAIMGHVPQGMAAAYRERIGVDRLRRVTEHVRNWLFPHARSSGGEPGSAD
jgi:integrase